MMIFDTKLGVIIVVEIVDDNYIKKNQSRDGLERKNKYE